MKAVVAAFNQEKALVGAFSLIVQPVVEPMEHYTALTTSHGHLMFLDPSDINWDRKGKDKMILLMSSHKISFN